MQHSQIGVVGLTIGPGAALKSRQADDGSWFAWIEVEKRSVETSGGQARVFNAPTRYQAQCQAYRWFYPESSFKTRYARGRRRSASG